MNRDSQHALLTLAGLFARASRDGGASEDAISAGRPVGGDERVSDTFSLRSFVARLFLPLWLCVSLAALVAPLGGTSGTTQDSTRALSTGSVLAMQSDGNTVDARNGEAEPAEPAEIGRDGRDRHHEPVGLTLLESEPEPEPEPEDASRDTSVATIRASFDSAPRVSRYGTVVSGAWDPYENQTLGTGLARGPPVAG